MLATRALWVTTTKLMQNIVWAIMLVVMSLGTPAARNCEARPAPGTTYGVAIGRNNNRLAAPRAPNRYRTRGMAIIVPSVVARTVAMIPMITLLPNASQPEPFST